MTDCSVGLSSSVSLSVTYESSDIPSLDSGSVSSGSKALPSSVAESVPSDRSSSSKPMAGKAGVGVSLPPAGTGIVTTSYSDCSPSSGAGDSESLLEDEPEDVELDGDATTRLAVARILFVGILLLSALRLGVRGSSSLSLALLSMAARPSSRFPAFLFRFWISFRTCWLRNSEDLHHSMIS